MKEITLKELLETTFTINEKGEMVGEFTLKRINMIGDILTNQYKEIERLNNIINELRKYIGSEYYCFDNESLEFKIAKDILNKLQELKGDGSNE